MKRLLFTGLLAFAVQLAMAQDVIVTTGLSFHSHDKLKSAQSNLNESAIELKSTQSFPPFLQYGIAMRFPISHFRISLGGNFYSTSTAARSTYEDYSGRLDIDQRLRCIGLGFIFVYALTITDQSKLNLYTSAGAEYSRLKMDINLRLFNQHDDVTDSYQAFSPFGEVGLEYRHNLSEKFFFQGGGILHLAQEAMLTNKKDDTEYQYVNWSGAKLMIGIGWRL